MGGVNSCVKFSAHFKSVIRALVLGRRKHDLLHEVLKGLTGVGEGRGAWTSPSERLAAAGPSPILQPAVTASLVSAGEPSDLRQSDLVGVGVALDVEDEASIRPLSVGDFSIRASNTSSVSFRDGHRSSSDRLNILFTNTLLVSKVNVGDEEYGLSLQVTHGLELYVSIWIIRGRPFTPFWEEKPHPNFADGVTEAFVGAQLVERHGVELAFVQTGAYASAFTAAGDPLSPDTVVKLLKCSRLFSRCSVFSDRLTGTDLRT
ncbi:hypothetical protein EYF80_017482 [Liparis tanakae]|uniref:Uncharacterized protein n=1 Tax=Liparis tanakae TaxID=230148 RepID=A0A4Z2I3D9_9TELE|nr:hypothetical protein EYF80_017482 [Liparis tanakae]